MIYYKVRTKWPEAKSLIEAVEVERATDKSVWINGGRNDVFTQYARYVPTYEEALRLVESIVSTKMTNAQTAIQEAEKLADALEVLKQQAAKAKATE